MRPILLRVAREYSKHQQNLIRNFYKHRDGIDTQRLQEIVTDISRSVETVETPSLPSNSKPAVTR